MSLINSVNFETGDLSQCLSNVSARVVGFVAIWGNFSLQILRNNSAANAVIGATATTSYNVPTAFYRWYFLYSLPATAGSHSGICNFQDSSNAYKAALHLDSGGHLQFYDHNGALISTGTTVLQPGVVYMLQAKIGGGTAAWEIRINGNTEIAGTSDLGAASNGSINLGGGLMYTSAFYYDEIAIDNAAYPADVTTPAPGIPTGTVGLTMDGASQGSMTLNAQGVATFTLTSPPPGTRNLLATLTSPNFGNNSASKSFTVSGGGNTQTVHLTDNLALTDTNGQKIAVNWFKKPAVPDNAGLTDSVRTIQLRPFQPIFLEYLAATDMVSRFVQGYRAISDNLALTDMVSNYKLAPRQSPGSDNFLALTDQLSAKLARALTTNGSDNLALTDSVTIRLLKPHSNSLGDNLALSDSVSRIAGFLRLAADKLAITDSASFLRFAGTTASENLALKDSATLFVPAHPTIQNNLGITDTVFTQRSTFRSITDNLGAQDGIAAPLHPLAGITAFWRVDAPLGRWRQDNPVTGQDWYMVRGEDKTIYVVSYDGPVNIKNWQIRWQLRTADGPFPIAVTVDTFNGLLQIADAKNGLMRLNIRSFQTAQLTIQASPWYWELARIDTHVALARGTLTIAQENATP